MDDINQIKNTLTTLTNNNSVLEVDKIKYDEKNFGNYLVIIKLRKTIDILFIKDKGDFWCEIGRNNDKFFIEDFFTVVGINPIKTPQKFADMITETSTEIIKHLAKIEEAFNDTNFKVTNKKVVEYAAIRTLGRF